MQEASEKSDGLCGPQGQCHGLKNWRYGNLAFSCGFLPVAWEILLGLRNQPSLGSGLLFVVPHVLHVKFVFSFVRCTNITESSKFDWDQTKCFNSKSDISLKFYA
jgi:hypothetical protein